MGLVVHSANISIMSLINWRNRYDVMPGFPKWVDHFFRDDDFANSNWPREMASPAVNVKETDNMFELEVAVPGMKRDDFILEVKEGMLFISAKCESEKEEKEDDYTRKEFNFSSFKRSFWLPENVVAEEIKANYKEGILLIELPKAKINKTEPSKFIQIE